MVQSNSASSAEVVGVNGLRERCRAFVEEQAAGEWDDKTIKEDADSLMKFVLAEIAALKEPAGGVG